MIYRYVTYVYTYFGVSVVINTIQPPPHTHTHARTHARTRTHTHTHTQSDQEKKLAEGWAPADFERIQSQASSLDAGGGAGPSAPPAPSMMKKKDTQAGFGGFAAQEHYAECYPG